jgi:pyrimidine operon attenuation protein/uracil phosphoribosyltransferase
VAKTQTLGPGEIQAALDRLAAAISARHASTEKLLLLGIANGGIELARRLAARLSPLASRPHTVCGVLDISFHRDDTGLTLSARDDEKVVVRLDPANPARDAIRVEAAASLRKSKVKN